MIKVDTIIDMKELINKIRKTIEGDIYGTGEMLVVSEIDNNNFMRIDKHFKEVKDILK